MNDAESDLPPPLPPPLPVRTRGPIRPEGLARLAVSAGVAVRAGPAKTHELQVIIASVAGVLVGALVGIFLQAYAVGLLGDGVSSQQRLSAAKFLAFAWLVILVLCVTCVAGGKAGAGGLVIAGLLRWYTHSGPMGEPAWYMAWLIHLPNFVTPVFAATAGGLAGALALISRQSNESAATGNGC